jgi:hypothetical protein
MKLVHSYSLLLAPLKPSEAARCLDVFAQIIFSDALHGWIARPSYDNP